ncbi:MAG: 3-phosphoshikimate 1-carboxyvinyltransferase [Woeseia sp.]
MHFIVNPTELGSGTLQAPGDKSISHRALMFGAIAEGVTRIRGFLPGEDCLSTMQALRALGVRIEHDGATNVTVHGVGLRGLHAPQGPLDLGNSGTAMRLFAGLLAGQAFDSELFGDASLSARPMARVITPLAEMGAEILGNKGRPPLRIHGGRQLHGIDYRMPVASAQVKSAVLLAGLYADGVTSVTEPAITRDHSERMFSAMGAQLDTADGCVRLQPGVPLKALDIEVPADLSSATFPMLAALLARDSKLELLRVGVNPTRDGVLQILRAMGARISVTQQSMSGAEPLGNLQVQSSTLSGIHVDPALVPLAIDEFPALFVAAAAARGTTEFRGLEELRVKESDRIAAMAQGLAALGIEVEELPDGARITGGQFRSGTVESCGDHRIAMAFAVAGTVADGPVRINDVASVATSFPGFERLLRELGADICSVAEKGA